MTVSYYASQPMYPQPGRPWGRIIGIGLAIGLVVSAAVTVAAVLISRPAVPEPITMQELMEAYEEINPYDWSANASNMATLAAQYCDQLDDDVVSVEEMRAGAEQSWPEHGDEVLQLMVSYGCPEHLIDVE